MNGHIISVERLRDIEEKERKLDAIKDYIFSMLVAKAMSDEND